MVTKFGEVQKKLLAADHAMLVEFRCEICRAINVWVAGACDCAWRSRGRAETARMVVGRAIGIADSK